MKITKDDKEQLCDICRDFNLCKACENCDFKDFMYDEKSHVYFKFDENYCRTDVNLKTGEIKRISPLGNVMEVKHTDTYTN